MSHFRTLRTKLTDAEILKATLRELGICVKTDAYVRGRVSASNFVVKTTDYLPQL